MSSSPDLIWQPSLFGVAEPVEIDPSFSRLRRIHLDDRSWVDHVPGWLSGSDAVFEAVLTGRRWEQRSRRLYDNRVVEPRLTSSWVEDRSEPLEPPILEGIRSALSDRYDRRFDSVGFNLYRDGQDSVAWHADRIAKEIEDPFVGLVSPGEPRRFLLRPTTSSGRRSSTVFLLGGGDLLVTGGRTQRDWEHSVPKVAEAGPRISLAYRHGMDPSAYAGKRVEAAPADDRPDFEPD